MGLYSNNRRICDNSVPGIADGILVVHFCGCPDSVGCVVYALLLSRASGKENIAVKVFVFRLPKFISGIAAKIKFRE